METFHAQSRESGEASGDLSCWYRVSYVKMFEMINHNAHSESLIPDTKTPLTDTPLKHRYPMVELST